MPKTHLSQINGEISPFYGSVKNPNVVSSQLDDSNGEYEFVLRENSGERSRVRQKKVAPIQLSVGGGLFWGLTAEREQARMMRGMGRAVAMMVLMEGCLGDLYLHVSVFFPDRRRQMGCLAHENLLAVVGASGRRRLAL